MIHENVPFGEAEKMVAAGGRILEHRQTDEGHMCVVETQQAAAPKAAEEPKKRGRPKGSGKG